MSLTAEAHATPWISLGSRDGPLARRMLPAGPMRLASLLRVSFLLGCSLFVAACGAGTDSNKVCRSVEGSAECFCDEDLTRDQFAVDTCSTESVKVEGAVSLCCQQRDEGDTSCECAAVGCYDDGSFCSCGQAIIVGDPGTTLVSGCFTATSSEHCCKDPVFKLCTCGVGDCIGSEIEVGSCSANDVAFCKAPSERVDSCD